MHSAPMMNSHFAEGTPLRLMGSSWGGKTELQRVLSTPTMASSAPCAPALRHRKALGRVLKDLPPGSPFLSPRGCPEKPWEAAWAGREHRWRPLCPSKAVPGAAGCRLRDNGHGHCEGTQGAWWLCLQP